AGDNLPGVGNATNGLIANYQGDYGRSLTDSRGAQWGPRFGLAWTPWGASSKTVIRTGGGVFFEKSRTGIVGNLANNPPVVRIPQVFYGNISTWAAASGAQTFFPV